MLWADYGFVLIANFYLKLIAELLDKIKIGFKIMVRHVNLSNLYLALFTRAIFGKQIIIGNDISVNTVFMGRESKIIVFNHIKITLFTDVNINHALVHDKILCRNFQKKKHPEKQQEQSITY